MQFKAHHRVVHSQQHLDVVVVLLGVPPFALGLRQFVFDEIQSRRKVCDPEQWEEREAGSVRAESSSIWKGLGEPNSITIADSHRGLRHVAHVSSENTVPLDTFLGFFHKVLLPFHKRARGHQPPVGPQAEVQLCPEHSDIEKQVLRRDVADRGHLGGTAGHPALAAKGRGGITVSGCSIFTSVSSRDHITSFKAQESKLTHAYVEGKIRKEFR
ncbi:hypothetical protein EYF80_005972 [Liparis tanakae]|uniref:Uncharacterized protein n=1 Tax=Liparis tanakae TaxID=230148 RepID=A0A4Z2J0W0_9TELE|nr:hypothetical protein EYF80_005972 [Liparis tanakae]